MSLRVATLADLDPILCLERECFEAPHWTRRDYLVVLEGVDRGAVRRRTYLWEEDGQVLGFAVAMLLVAGGMSDAQIENLAVAKPARRRGLARELCEAAIAWCAQQGAAAIGLEVRASNAPAIALYSRLGFLEIGTRTRYYTNPIEDALMMERTLSTP